TSYGIQLIGLNPDKRSRTELRLRPVVPVMGRLTADDVRILPNQRVHVRVYSDNPSAANDEGMAEVVTDSQGRFSVPAVPQGRLSAWVIAPEDSRYAAREISLEGPNRPGRYEVEIPLKRMVNVWGIVREKGAGKPIPGVGVGFGSHEVLGLLPRA